MNDAETNVLAIDIESVNPSVGPVRACGFVLVAYRGLLHYEVIDRVQFVVERSADEYGADGKRFWKEISPAIDQYYEHPSTPRLSPANAALHIRNYVDHCLATVPKLSILVDDPQTDHSLLYDFLKTHKQRPLSLAANGDHKKNLYVSRDLMRGSFSMIDRRFINLAQSDMYLYINRYWLDLVSKHLQEERISPPVITLNSSGLSFAVSKSKQFVQDNSSYVFRTQIGPDSKHVPVFDATQSLILWAKMEDIKRLFHHQLMKIAMMTPSVLVLPKPDDSAHVR